MRQGRWLRWLKWFSLTDRALLVLGSASAVPAVLTGRFNWSLLAACLLLAAVLPALQRRGEISPRVSHMGVAISLGLAAFALWSLVWWYVLVGSALVLLVAGRLRF